MNSELEIQLRRFRHNLAIGGRFYIIFGIWDVIKITLLITMGDVGKEAIAEVEVEGEGDLLLLYVCIAVALVFVSAFILFLHLMVGRNAIRFGRGQKNRIRFFVFTILAAMISFFALSTYPLDMMAGFYNIDEVLLASLLVDLSVAYLVVNLIYSAVRMEMITRQLKVRQPGSGQEAA